MFIMRWQSLLSCFLLFLTLPAASGFKILVYNPRFSHSHSSWIGHLTDILVRAGHDVTSLIPEIDRHAKDGTKLSKIIRVPADSVALETHEENDGMDVDFWDDDLTYSTALIIGEKLKAIFCSQCNSTINHPGLLEQLRNEHFDLVINENFDYCGMGISHVIGAKSTIVLSTTTLFDHVAYDLGVPLVPSINPAFYTLHLHIHSLSSRFWNAFYTYTSFMRWNPTRDCCSSLFTDKFGVNFPHIKKLTAEASFVFTNSDPFIDFARPLLRKVVDLGGIGIREPKPLGQEWDEILNQREHNVLVSFGSVAKSSVMKIDRKRAFLKAFSHFPAVTFIWKYESPEDEFATKEVVSIPNVVLRKWTPQNDLLNDTRMTAFVSHGGAGSSQEAAARGVPVLFIPLFGDQPRNAVMMENSGVAVTLSKFEAADEKKLMTSLHRLLETERERLTTNAQKISAMLAKRPISPEQLFIRHAEFAAEFGRLKSLTPRSLELSFVEYFHLDAIFVSFAAASFLLLSIVVLVRVCLRSCSRVKSDKIKRS